MYIYHNTTYKVVKISIPEIVRGTVIFTWSTVLNCRTFFYLWKPFNKTFVPKSDIFSLITLVFRILFIYVLQLCSSSQIATILSQITTIIPPTKWMRTKLGPILLSLDVYLERITFGMFYSTTYNIKLNILEKNITNYMHSWFMKIS